MTRRDRGRIAVAWWAVGGVGLTFVEAIVRLGQRGWRALDAGLTGPQWLALALGTLLLGYVEGHRALQRRFAPDVVARALELAARATVVQRVLAPLYAVSLLGPPRPALVRAWLVAAAIATAVVAVRMLPEPWRGLVDLAVAVALAWGLVALAARFAEEAARHAS